MKTNLECRVALPSGPCLSSVFKALQQKKIAATTIAHCLNRSPHGHTLTPIQLGMVADLQNGMTITDRLKQLLQMTLISLLNEISILNAPLPLAILLPAKNSMRYQPTLPGNIQDLVVNAVPTAIQQALTFQFWHEDDNVIDVFFALQQQVQMGFVNHAIFGGVDSFIGIKAIREFEKKNGTIRQQGNPDAPLLSEGAVFFTLTKDLPSANKNAPLPITSPTRLITDRGVRCRDEFQWAEKKIPAANALQELHLQKWLGHHGAAQFPLQLALGFYWASLPFMDTSPIVLCKEQPEIALIYLNQSQAA